MALCIFRAGFPGAHPLRRSQVALFSQAFPCSVPHTPAVVKPPAILYLVIYTFIYIELPPSPRLSVAFVPLEPARDLRYTWRQRP